MDACSSFSRSRSSPVWSRPLSPCVLPALPVVLAGGAGGGPRRVAGIAVGFVASFALVTLALATALRSVGLGPDALRNLAIAGAGRRGRDARRPGARRARRGVPRAVARLGERLPRGRSGMAGRLLVGVALGLVWTPCAGPVFAAIAAVAATGDAGVSAFAVLIAYAVGAILPLCLIAAGGRRLVGRVRGRWAEAVRPALGVLMIAAAVIVALGLDTRLTTYVVRDLPAYTDALQALERSPEVGAGAGGAAARRAYRHPALPRGRAGRRGGPARSICPMPVPLPSCGDLRDLQHRRRTAEAVVAAGQGRARRLLDLLLHELPPDDPAPAGAPRALPRTGPDGARGPHARIRLRGRRRQRGRRGPRSRHHLPGGARSGLRDLGRVRDALLADDLPASTAGARADLHVGEGDEARTEELLRRALGVRRASRSPARRESCAGRSRGDARDLGRGGAHPEARPGAARATAAADPLRGARGPRSRRRGLRRGVDARRRVGEGGRAGRDRACLPGEGRLPGPRRRGRRRGPPGPRADRRPGRPPTTRRGRTSPPVATLAVDSPRLYRLLELPRTTVGRIRIELARHEGLRLHLRLRPGPARGGGGGGGAWTAHRRATAPPGTTAASSARSEAPRTPAPPAAGGGR